MDIEIVKENLIRCPLINKGGINKIDLDSFIINNKISDEILVNFYEDKLKKTKLKKQTEIFGWTDVLSVGDKVRVKFTGHEAVISEVVGKVYVLNPPDPADTTNWHFRVRLELLEPQ